MAGHVKIYKDSRKEKKQDKGTQEKVTCKP